MVELSDIFCFYFGEVIEGGLQAILAVLLVVVGIVVMLSALVFDGVFLWGLVLFLAGVFAIRGFFDVFF